MVDLDTHGDGTEDTQHHRNLPRRTVRDEKNLPEYVDVLYLSVR